MKDPIENKVYKWVQNGEDKYSDINLRIIHLNHWLFSDYEPTLGPGPNFLKRLGDWLENINDEEDQKILFELVPNIFYVGREELNVLYREAYQTIFARWLIDQIKSDFSSSTVLEDLNAEIINTWFCPFTDSLRINQFYHINNIPSSHNLRPDWKSLITLGNNGAINNYIISNNIQRIVLLEDFIGNGDQVSKTVQFLAANMNHLSILIIPLIICPTGLKNISAICKANPKISIFPVVSVPENYFVHELESDIESDFFKKLHAVAKKTYDSVDNNRAIDNKVAPYGPFGWKKTGGVIVMHTNTPDNSLPLIHNESETWKPLFKRHKRV